MLSGSELSFHGITRAIFARLRRRAAQHGIHVIRPAGEAVKDGVRIRWKYDPGAALLKVQCIRAPFWVNASSIDRKLSQEIEAALESNRAA